MLGERDLINLVSDSPLFDASYYLENHPDAALSGLGAAEHYLRFGGRLGRDPSPDFDSAGYLETYRDVAARGDNPLVHFEMHGRGERRAPRPRGPVRSQGRDQEDVADVDVIVPVFDALEYVQACLTALSECDTGLTTRVLVINDGSGSETTKWLRTTLPGLGNDTTRFELIEHAGNEGYTKAVNTGLRASTAPFVVTLNSDTIVTPFWADGLVRCLKSDETLGIAGPLSNAASWQNVPTLMADDGGFAVNGLPAGFTPPDIAAVVRRASRRLYPRSPFLNGFCFMVRREVIDAIGYMDEIAFPTGYGEENDYCMRAQDAGFTLAIADDTYVYHAKSKSFGSARRVELSEAGGAAIREKHGALKFESLLEQVKRTQEMDLVRDRVAQALESMVSPTPARAADFVTGMKVLFLLPVRGGVGGTHSVVQEAAAMRQMGVDVRIAVHDADYFSYMDIYSDIPDAGSLFTGFREETVVATAQSYDVVVATIFSSVRLIERIVQTCPWILPVYYAQDYEPLFFETGSDMWAEAQNSYGLIPDAVIIAKTHWLCREIEKNHPVKVHKIEPSLDHDVYAPDASRGAESSVIRLSAMIRPATPRRGAGRTMELLARLHANCGSALQIDIFGCNDEDPEFQELPRDFKFRNHGVLTRPEVAGLLRETDIFIDLSDYQAFGRTGLEAMACGATAVVPQAGGSDEYAIDGVNALVVDSLDIDACYDRIAGLVETPGELGQMRLNALQTAARYSPRRAATSELVTFARALAERRLGHPKPIRPKVTLLPGLTGSGNVTITGSGFVRLLCPYRQDALARDWEIGVLHDGSLPEPGSADIAVLQRDLFATVRDQFDGWHAAWRQHGGRLIYEIDDDLTDVDALVKRGYADDADALADRVRRFADAADLITVSTEHLASVLSDWPEKIRVVPNFIDVMLWRPRDAPTADTPNDGLLKIGYFGTPTHTEDLMMVREVMEQVAAREDVEIEVVGAFEGTEPLFGSKIDLPSDNVYPVFVDWLKSFAHWDIVIIPLADTAFNRSKSNLKFIESAALGTAIICSDTEEFGRIGRDGDNCLMVQNDPESWKQAITRLIEDAPLRRRLAENALHDARKKWTVQGNRNSYHSVLSSAFATV